MIGWFSCAGWFDWPIGLIHWFDRLVLLAGRNGWLGLVCLCGRLVSVRWSDWLVALIGWCDGWV